MSDNKFEGLSLHRLNVAKIGIEAYIEGSRATIESVEEALNHVLTNIQSILQKDIDKINALIKLREDNR